VKADLVYAYESLTFIQRTVNRLQVFINKCLCKIVNVGLHWPDKISNNDLRTKTYQEPELIQIKRRKWSCKAWTHVRRNDDSIAIQPLQWTPQGHGRRGRLRNTRTSVREYVFYVFFSDLKKNMTFYVFLK